MRPLASADLPGTEARGQWLRLRTLIRLRWVAIAGQLAALAVAEWGFGLEVPTWPALAVIGAAVVVNLAATAMRPGSVHLPESGALLVLGFDLIQLAALLFLAGGLNNPFAVFLLIPATIAASALGARAAVILGVATIALSTLLAWLHLPLRGPDDAVLAMPPIFVLGFWTALVVAVSFLALYAWRVTGEVNAMSDALRATQMALAREQALTDLGGVVAAAAHELGSPLATITLLADELAEELQDRSDLAENAATIRAQADRCRDALRRIGEAARDEAPPARVPLADLIEEAAAPHKQRGKQIHVTIAPARGVDAREPTLPRRPEIIHGVRNLIQNGVDFARAEVWIEGEWTDEALRLRVLDDGPGYPARVLARIGEPFLRRRGEGREADGARGNYEGMGLGLFIAKTLLERSGARLSFSNGGHTRDLDGHPRQVGAAAEVIWPRSAPAVDIPVINT